MFKAINIVMVVLFLVSAGLQYNDPDPGRWMAIYAAAAIVSLAEGKLGKGSLVAPLAVTLVALAWAGVIAHGMVENVTIPELFKRMDVHQPQIEEGREIGGLLIVASWMLTLAIRSFQRF